MTRAILCPLCNNGLTLDGFEITEHEDGTWSADAAVECTHVLTSDLAGYTIEVTTKVATYPCGARFYVIHSRAQFLPSLPKQDAGLTKKT